MRIKFYNKLIVSWNESENMWTLTTLKWFIILYCCLILIMDVSSGADVPTRLMLIECVNFKIEQHASCYDVKFKIYLPMKYSKRLTGCHFRTECHINAAWWCLKLKIIYAIYANIHSSLSSVWPQHTVCSNTVTYMCLMIT